MNRIKKIVAASAALLLTTGAVGIASAQASPTAKTLTTNVTYVQAFQGVVVTGENFAKNSKVTILECRNISNHPNTQCDPSNSVRVAVNGHGTFHAAIAVRHCGGQTNSFGQRCYLGVADPNTGPNTTNLMVSTKVFVAFGPGI
jgi:hypothetical protein